MKEEIKGLIAKLNNGEAPKGYRKTDFGIFPNDWVTNKKLKDIGAFGKGKGIPGNKMQTEGVPCVGYGDIYMKYNFHFEKALSFVDEETAEDSQLIKKGTLLFTGTGETAEEIGKCVCYNGQEDIFAGGDIITFNTEEVDPLFLAYQQYQNFSLKKKASFGQGHSVVHIQKDNLEKLNIAYPKSKEEQSKIAEILMKWDKAIELYQEQIEALEKLKKAYLSVMFPKKGETTPKYRFKGFTDPWEQRKFSELTEIRSASRVHKEEWQSSGVPFYRSSDVMAALNGTENEKAFISEELFEKLSAVSGKLEKGDVLVTGGGSVGKPYIVPNNEPLYTKDADLLWIKNNENLEPYFVYTFFFSPTFTDYLNSVSHVGTIAHYTITQLGETPITLPCVSEQQKIGEYFRNLDTLITLHQRKKETIIKQRKVLQQYLLNGIVRV